MPSDRSDTIRRPFPRDRRRGNRKRRPVAANSLGEEKSPAKARGITPARIAAIGALAVVVIALGYVIFFSGSGGHKYNLVFQNASQLVPENQVLIGGHPVGSVESIELTDNNLAKVTVSVEQELHEGTTATIRATCLAGVANHYVSISPGPNSNPALDEGATLGLGSTTTPVDLDQFLNTFPTPVRRGLGQFVRGNAAIYSGRAEDANQTFKYFGPALNRTGAFLHELNADQALLRRFVVSSSEAHHRRRRTRQPALQRDLQREHRLRRDRPSEHRLRPDPAAAAAGLPPEQHDLRQPPRRARRRRTAVRNGEAGDEEPGALPGRTAPGPLQSRAGVQESAAHRRPQGLRQRQRRTARRPARGRTARRQGLPPRRRSDCRLPAEPQLRSRLHPRHLQRLRQARPGHRLLRRQRPLRPRPVQRPQPLQGQRGQARTDCAERTVRSVRRIGRRQEVLPRRRDPVRARRLQPVHRTALRRLRRPPVQECNPADVPPGP